MSCDLLVQMAYCISSQVVASAVIDHPRQVDKCNLGKVKHRTLLASSLPH